MYKKIALLTIATALFAGCSSVPMESDATASLAKEFNPPTANNAGLYIYRDSFVGKALKKDILVDGKCIGETADAVFFYEEVVGEEEHTVSTESEFSPNDLLLFMETGKNYFIRQYIKLGVLVGGADLERVSEEKGKEAVKALGMAKKGVCST
jgi:hypothetical protein